MSLTENQRFIIKLIVFFALATGFIIVLPKLQSLITIIIISILFFTLLDPLVDKLERYRIPRGLSALLVILLLLVIIAFGVSRIIPHVEGAAQQISQSFSSQSSMNDRLEETINRINETLPVSSLTSDLPEKITELANSLKVKIPGLLLGVGKGLANTVYSFFFILFITFFFLKDERSIKKGLIKLVPNRHFEMSLNIMYKIQEQLSSYLQGLFLAATSVGVTSIIGLFIVNSFFDAGINYIVLIGVWAGFANLIPYIGPIAGAIPAVISVLLRQPPNMFLIVALVIGVFLIVQFIDNTVTSPYLVGKSVDLHPLIVFLVLIIGGNLMGLLGMLFAVPVAGIIKVMFTEIITNAPKYQT